MMFETARVQKSSKILKRDNSLYKIENKSGLVFVQYDIQIYWSQAVRDYQALI